MSIGAQTTGRHKRDASGREDRWYVVRVHPGQERVAATHLEQQAYGAFVPTYTPDGKTKTGKGRTRLPLFPGYIFAMFDIAFDRWQPINSTRGVMHLLPLNRETPLPIPTEFVERIMARVEAGDFEPEELEDILSIYTKGQEVQIVGGPLAGFPGTVAKRRGKALELLVLIFGRATPATVSVEDVARPQAKPCAKQKHRAA